MKVQTDTEVRNTGISFCGLLGIVFIVLKLCGVIDWSWWLVTAPLWIPLALALVTLFVILFIIATKETLDDYHWKKRRK